MSDWQAAGGQHAPLPRRTNPVLTLIAAPVAQRAFARRIRALGGHLLIVAKANQPALEAAIARVVTDPPLPATSGQGAAVTTYDKGPGHLERLHLERTAALTGYLVWPPPSRGRAATAAGSA